MHWDFTQTVKVRYATLMSNSNSTNTIPNSSIVGFLSLGCSGPEYYPWTPATYVTPNINACYTYVDQNGLERVLSAKVDIPGAALFMYKDSISCEEPYSFDSPDLGGGCYQSSEGWMSFRIFMEPPSLISSVSTNTSSTVSSSSTSSQNTSSSQIGSLLTF